MLLYMLKAVFLVYGVVKDYRHIGPKWNTSDSGDF